MFCFPFPDWQVTDDGAAEDEEDEEEEAGTVVKEEEVEAVDEREVIPSASSISLPDAAPAHVLSSNDPLLDKIDDPHHSSLEPSAPLSSTLPSSGHQPESTNTPELLFNTSNAPSVDDGHAVAETEIAAAAAATESSSLVALLECCSAIPPRLLCQEKSEHCLLLPESSALPDPPETLEPPAFCSTPSFPLESSSSIPSLQLLSPSTGLFVIPLVEEQQKGDDVGERFQSSPQEKQEQEKAEDDPAILSESSNPVAQSAQSNIQVAQVPIASDLLIHEHPGDLPSVNKDHPDLPSSSSSSSSSDSIEEDSLMGQNPKAAEGIDRDSLEEAEEVEDDDEDASSSDDFVYLQLDERDEAPDGYFDDEPNGMVGSSDPSLMHLTPQLWRTVILEESEPNSKEMSPLLCSDSGIVAGTPSPPVPSVVDSATGADADAIGPITKAVSRWLESAPIQQQLIASSTVLLNDETDDEDGGDYDDDYQEDEVMEEMVSVPKNGVATLRTAPSSDETVTDGPLRRVDPSEEAIVQDLPPCSTEEEPPVQPLSQHCDPAKFSVYYQLGVSVDVDGDGQVKGEVEEGGDSVLEDSATAALIQSTLDDSIEQCPLTTDSTSLPAQAVDMKKRRKRNAWRRVLLLHRAVHKSRSGDDANAPTADNLKTRRLKSGPSCCALQ